MLAVIGLGNPGAAYQGTRHNVGFLAVDALARMLGIAITKNKCRALAGEGLVAGNRVALLKPQTFMNLSGLSVQDALNWYKLEPEQVLVISDDVDLRPGALRIRPHGGAGTHNGWRSILQQTGSDRFPRIRVGVGGPPPQWDLADWVLSRFGEDEPALQEAIEQAAQAADCFLRHGIDLAMNRYNKRRPDAPAAE